jgi:hypothetical protein
MSIYQWDTIKARAPAKMNASPSPENPSSCVDGSGAPELHAAIITKTDAVHPQPQDVLNSSVPDQAMRPENDSTREREIHLAYCVERCRPASNDLRRRKVLGQSRKHRPSAGNLAEAKHVSVRYVCGQGSQSRGLGSSAVERIELRRTHADQARRCVWNAPYVPKSDESADRGERRYRSAIAQQGVSERKEMGWPAPQRSVAHNEDMLGSDDKLVESKGPRIVLSFCTAAKRSVRVLVAPTASRRPWTTRSRSRRLALGARPKSKRSFRLLRLMVAIAVEKAPRGRRSMPRCRRASPRSFAEKRPDGRIEGAIGRPVQFVDLSRPVRLSVC